MRLRLRLLFAAAILGPLAAIGMLGVRGARNEEARAEREIRVIVDARLRDLAGTAASVMSELERGLGAETEALPPDVDALRALARARPNLRRLMILTARGHLRFPPTAAPASDEERRFVDETADLREHGALAHPPRDERTGAVAPSGWLTAPGADATGLIYWHDQPDGTRAAVLLPGPSLLAALVTRLPATAERGEGASSPGAGTRSDAAPAEDRIALEDPSGRIGYQWGNFTPPRNAAPFLTRALDPPLGAWRLAYFAPGAPGAARGVSTGWALGMGALALAIVGVGTWLYRESTREIRLGTQRVSFVNQVSHELKTPLTNIRMYAELLEEHLDGADLTARQHLGVVVRESQRLARLINNILTFSRSERGRVTVHPTPGIVDDIVREVVEHFRPGLSERGVTIEIEGGAPARVLVDADALSQIVGNLLGNVEKYAPGRPLRVRTSMTGRMTTTIVVQDGGPGIRTVDAETVFRPFVRLGTAAHEAAPGTGIGLGIARDLARLHGGDLRLRPDAGRPGACFEITLRTEETS
jgi:signal transduction histidine kinase